MSTEDDELHVWAREALEQASDQDDGLTSARLRAARLRALEHARRPRTWQSGWAPAAAATAAVVIALTYSVQHPDPPAVDPDAEVVELLADVPDLELVEELEFYRWLDSHEHAG